MEFDMDKTLDDMLGVIAGIFAADWPKLKACTMKALQEEKEVLSAIAQARLDNEIDDDEMKSQLDDENEVLRAALLVCKVKAKVMAQKAANAAIKVLTDAIKVAL